MPCYTEPDPKAEREHARHNSEVADMLCTVMRALEKQYGTELLKGMVDWRTLVWWTEHKARDTEKEKREKELHKAAIEAAKQESRAAALHLERLLNQRK